MSEQIKAQAEAIRKSHESAREVVRLAEVLHSDMKHLLDAANASVEQVKRSSIEQGYQDEMVKVEERSAKLKEAEEALAEKQRDLDAREKEIVSREQALDQRTAELAARDNKPTLVTRNTERQDNGDERTE